MLQQMLWCRWNATSWLDADNFPVINLSGALCCRRVFNHHFLVQLQSWNIFLNCTHLMKKFFPAVHTPVTSCVREVWPVGKSPMDDPQTVLGKSPNINRGPCKCIVRAGYVELYRGYFPIFMLNVNWWIEWWSNEKPFDGCSFLQEDSIKLNWVCTESGANSFIWIHNSSINIFQTPTLNTRVSSSLYQSMTIYYGCGVGIRFGKYRGFLEWIVLNMIKYNHFNGIQPLRLFGKSTWIT